MINQNKPKVAKKKKNGRREGKISSRTKLSTPKEKIKNRRERCYNFFSRQNNSGQKKTHTHTVDTTRIHTNENLKKHLSLLFPGQSNTTHMSKKALSNNQIATQYSTSTTSRHNKRCNDLIPPPPLHPKSTLSRHQNSTSTERSLPCLIPSPSPPSPVTPTKPSPRGQQVHHRRQRRSSYGSGLLAARPRPLHDSLYRCRHRLHPALLLFRDVGRVAAHDGRGERRANVGSRALRDLAKERLSCLAAFAIFSLGVGVKLQEYGYRGAVPA